MTTPTSNPSPVIRGTGDGVFVGGRTRQRRIWMQVSDADWHNMYVEQVFTDRWRDYYWQLITGFRKQYAPKSSERVQYQVLVARLATAVTTVSMLEAEGGVATIDGEKYVSLDSLSDRGKLDGVIRRCIAQLQRYTEAQKHEVTIRDDAVHQTLEKVVGAVELSIPPGPAQIALLEAIISIANGETIKAPTPVNGSVIEHEPKMLEAGTPEPDVDDDESSGYEADGEIDVYDDTPEGD